MNQVLRRHANKPVHLQTVLFRHGEIIHFLPLEDRKKTRAQHFGSIYRHIQRLRRRSAISFLLGNNQTARRHTVVVVVVAEITQKSTGGNAQISIELYVFLTFLSTNFSMLMLTFFFLSLSFAVCCRKSSLKIDGKEQQASKASATQLKWLEYILTDNRVNFQKRWRRLTSEFVNWFDFYIHFFFRLKRKQTCNKTANGRPPRKV